MPYGECLGLDSPTQDSIATVDSVSIMLHGASFNYINVISKPGWGSIEVIHSIHQESVLIPTFNLHQFVHPSLQPKNGQLFIFIPFLLHPWL